MKTVRISSASIRSLRRRILSWYQKNGRHDLPWRRNPSPYRVLVSEIMLQQTQVSRVVPKYKVFMRLFPTFSALAGASPAQVLRVWSGLGYNRRALMLQKLAVQVIEKHSGRLPDEYEALKQLPGIGEYTAHAINVFARNKPEACIDTNVRRVLIHELRLPTSISTEALTAIAKQVLPKGKSREWHSALMDYGALEATAKATGVASSGPKQPSFKNSDRQIRGAIVRALVTKSSNVENLTKQLAFPLRRVEAMIKRLFEEGVIGQTGNRLHLPRRSR